MYLRALKKIVNIIIYKQDVSVYHIFCQQLNVIFMMKKIIDSYNLILTCTTNTSIADESISIIIYPFKL
jgi:hypothetical protein